MRSKEATVTKSSCPMMSALRYVVDGGEVLGSSHAGPARVRGFVRRSTGNSAQFLCEVVRQPAARGFVLRRCG
eukprot:CAMPEP_0204352004 /NCGR_PEP_ID=MMETSP0469-20131031/31554_1 /ASSEMBLY_ACC=CAM_ASM_000384 /TAXON_ID=2969 /ORGANISM="Oxyrrhis marina" /LENGTH=72 /DNA_ID=CAMNT_0051338665 /DNA_START=25 /DNA_END=243 /DNA_ORIENTATION=-